MHDTQSVSVIIPVYNDMPSLYKCIEGITNQRYPKEKIEIIVVDNNSTPPISVEDFREPNITVLHCPKPGSYAARNAGASIAKGDVLAFTDADCIPQPQWLTEAVQLLEEEGGERIVGGEVSFTTPRKPTLTAKYQLATGFQQKENIEKKGFSATANLICKKSTFNKVGMFDEDLLSGGDREWCWRAHNKGALVQYGLEACVTTTPRNSFLSAMRQARRVAGGRRELLSRDATHIENDNVAPHNSALGSVLFLMLLKDHSLLDRTGMLIIAGLLRLAAIVETVRLKLGAPPERR